MRVFNFESLEEYWRKVFEKNRKLFIAAMIVSVAALAAANALNRVRSSDFSPINGDFQNYNPVRRFLEGQAPFKDFALYLGLGPLALEAAFGFFFGNNFTANLFATNMLVVLIFGALAFSVGFLALRNCAVASLFSAAAVLLNFARRAFFSSWAPFFNIALTAGNSARMLRGAIVPLTVLAAICFLKTRAPKKFALKIISAVFAGVSILWSNDFGIANYISFSFLYFLACLKFEKNFFDVFKSAALYISLSLLSLLAFVFIFTRGNILDWFTFNFGVSQYQPWYYNARMFLSLRDFTVAHHIVLLSIAPIIVFDIIMFFRSNDNKYAFTKLAEAHALLAAYAGAVIYNVAAGNQEYEVITMVLWLIVAALVIKMAPLVLDFFKVRVKLVKIAVFAGGAAMLLASLAYAYYSLYILRYRDESLVYVKSLNGYLSSGRADEINTALEKISGEKIFSTYASAVEAATDQYQPSGYDYIIHVLGDEARRNYLDSFAKADFRYVSTILDNLTVYETHWTRPANWFFYRELYKYYKPTFTNGYQVYWEKSGDGNLIAPEDLNAEAELVKVGDNKYLIRVSTDGDFNGICDVKLGKVATKFKRVFSNLDIKKLVRVGETTAHINPFNRDTLFGIKSNSEGEYIPITIINGEGRAEITSYPENNTTLEISSIDAEGFYRAPFSFANAENINDGEFKGGVSSGNEILVKNTAQNKFILQDAKKIRSGETELDIINVSEDDGYLRVYTRQSASPAAYPNIFEIIE